LLLEDLDPRWNVQPEPKFLINSKDNYQIVFAPGSFKENEEVTLSLDLSLKGLFLA